MHTRTYASFAQSSLLSLMLQTCNLLPLSRWWNVSFYLGDKAKQLEVLKVRRHYSFSNLTSLTKTIIFLNQLIFIIASPFLMFIIQRVTLGVDIDLFIFTDFEICM